MERDQQRKTKIWIDADACPKVIKEVVYKVSSRLKIPVTLVANAYMNIPHSPLINFIKVDQGADVADQYIVDNASPTDIIITADIPLADLIIKKGAIALNPRGELYDEENIGEKLATRDLFKDLRDSGLVSGGPDSFGPKDKQNFTNALDRLLAKMI